MTSLNLRVAAFMAGAAASSCNLVTPTTHILLGNSYDPVNHCLNPQQGFDVVDGPFPNGTCPVVCITDAKTGTAYVTDVCPPYPDLDTVETGEGGCSDAPDTCTAALAAWNAGDECGASSDAAADAPTDGLLDSPIDSPLDSHSEGSSESEGGRDADHG
jgi:hypothetical protein